MSSDLDKILGREASSCSISTGDICKVIVTASKHKVSKLSFGDLVVEFHLPLSREDDDTQPGTSSTPRVKPVPEQTIKEEEERLRLEANVLAREAELDQLQILEPDKYEALIAQGELEDGLDGNAGPTTITD